MINPWSEERTVKGSPPVGEVSVRCDGCRRRFVAGESYKLKIVDGLRYFVAHPSCAELVAVS